MKKTCDIVVSISFILLLATVSLSYILVKDKDFSENENRYLSQKPKLTLESIGSGKYTEDIEKYMDDQIIWREGFIEVKTESQKALGNKDINGVYIGKDGYLIEKHLEKDFNYGQLNENIDIIRNFIGNNKDKDVSLMVVPTAGLILKDKLPLNAPILDQDKIIDMVKDGIEGTCFIDLRAKLMENKDQAIYYKTDHHWTSLGAFYGYKEWSKKKGLEIDVKDYKVTTISDSFKGTLYSKLLNKNSVKDSIEIYEKTNGKAYTVNYNYGKSTSTSVYNLKKLEEKDKYQVFLGGNEPEVKILTNNKKSGNLLVVKDSYANAFIPFLLKDYGQISIIDLRYFKSDLEEYMDKNSISDVLILYNIMSFSNDKNLLKLYSN